MHGQSAETANNLAHDKDGTLHSTFPRDWWRYWKPPLKHIKRMRALVEHLFTSAQTFCVGWVLKGVGALCPSIGGTHRIWDVSWQRFTIQPVQPSFDHDLSICQLFVISTIWRQIEKWPEIRGSTGWITARCMFKSLTCNLRCMNATCRFQNVPSLEKIKRPNGAVQWSMKCHRDVFTWPSPWASRSIDV